MARKIRLWPDVVLTQKCLAADLADPDLPALIDDLFDTMYAANGRGLAAPQIGVLQRVFVVDVTWKDGIGKDGIGKNGNRDPRVFINPEILTTDGANVTMDEQCLSIPDLPMPVARPEIIHLRWNDRDGKSETAGFNGILSRCIQHECDHLNGTVIFDHQRPQTRADLKARYVP